MSSSSPSSSQSTTPHPLSTYELLERILLCLDIHTLHTLHSVSKTFSSILSRSTPLRELMYLHPTSAPITPIQSLYNYYSSRTRTIYRPFPCQLNPCGEVLGLMNKPAGRGHRIPLLTFGLSDQNLFLQFEIKGFPVVSNGEEQASWKRMYLTQPPVTAVNFEYVRRDAWSGAMTVWNPAGVRLGDLEEMVGRMRREFEEARTGEEGGVSFESLSFCLFHPFTDDQMEEAW